MSQARRGRRILAVAACMVVLAAFAGCRRSPFTRLVDSPPPGASKAVASVERSTIADLAPNVATPTSGVAESPAPEVAETAPRPTVPASSAEATAAVEPIRTPLLDAALARAEAVEEDRNRVIHEAEEADRRSVPVPELPPIGPETPSTPPPTTSDQPLAPAPAEPQPAPVAEPAATTTEPDPAPPSPPAEASPTPKVDEAVAPASIDEAPAPTPPPSETTAFDAPPAAEGPAPATEEAPRLAINTALLCRKIQDFGSYEPLDAQALRAGRAALVYCELSGLEYLPTPEGYLAKIATQVELIRPSDGRPVWKAEDKAEDPCQAKRRDAFVGTMVTFPKSIAPGAYTLRIHQTDASTDRTASAEIPVTIVR